MNLRTEIDSQLTLLREGHKVDRARMIKLLTNVINEVPADAHVPEEHDLFNGYPLKNHDEPIAAPVDGDEGRVVLKQEGTPVRFFPETWGKHGFCKRCSKNDFTRGNAIVRIYGTGWWHDHCYKILNPRFYEGL
jgi:hypothetical protein